MEALGSHLVADHWSFTMCVKNGGCSHLDYRKCQFPCRNSHFMHPPFRQNMTTLWYPGSVAGIIFSLMETKQTRTTQLERMSHVSLDKNLSASAKPMTNGVHSRNQAMNIDESNQFNIVDLWILDALLKNNKHFPTGYAAGHRPTKARFTW